MSVAKPPKIKVTEDYDQFRYIAGNRKLNSIHLANLIESIKDKNLLPFNPIIVDKDMGIVDGQHRIQAAKNLSLPVYYTVANDIEFDDITRLNAFVQQWGIAEYLNAWIERGKEEYQKVQDFMEKWSLTPSSAVALLNVDEDSMQVKAPNKEFKAGNFQVVDEDHSNKLADYINKINNYVDVDVRLQRRFQEAVQRSISNPDVSMELFIERLDSYPEPLRRQITLVDWLRSFEDAYNRGQMKKVRFYG